METNDTSNDDNQNYISFAGTDKISYKAILEHVEILEKLEKESRTNMSLGVDQLKDL